MPIVNPRTLINRWISGTVPEVWVDAQKYLKDALRRLEGVLRVIHAAAEHPGVTAGARVAASGNTTINSGVNTDITGATVNITPSVDGNILVMSNALVECATFSASTDRLNLLLVVNGVTQSYGAAVTFSAVADRKTETTAWMVPVSAGTTYTVKLQGVRAAGLSTFTVIAASTGFLWFNIPNLYKVT